MKTEDLAKICHEANRAYCETQGDYSQVSWESAPYWQQNSCIDGVMTLLSHPDKTPEEMHENWVEFKKRDGWTYAEEKNSELKTHPCLVDYKDLPEMQKVKDVIFKSIVNGIEFHFANERKSTFDRFMSDPEQKRLFDEEHKEMLEGKIATEECM